MFGQLGKQLAVGHENIIVVPRDSIHDPRARLTCSEISGTPQL